MTTMKFKVGDRVKINCTYPESERHGLVCEVKRINYPSNQWPIAIENKKECFRNLVSETEIDLYDVQLYLL